MEIEDAQRRAIVIREHYAALEQKIYGRSWTREQIAIGFVGDVGDLMKLIMANEGVRDIPDAHEKLTHELADCLWAILVLARLYDIDLEQAFVRTMDDLEGRIAAQSTR